MRCLACCEWITGVAMHAHLCTQRQAVFCHVVDSWRDLHARRLVEYDELLILLDDSLLRTHVNS